MDKMVKKINLLLSCVLHSRIYWEGEERSKTVNKKCTLYMVVAE